MNRWLLAAVLWLAFNASVMLFAWLSYRDDEPDDFADWEAELSWSSRKTGMRQHPSTWRGGRA